MSLLKHDDPPAFDKAVARLRGIYFYTSGYHGLIPEDYASIPDNFCLVDIRLSAHSRFPVWRKKHLESVYNGTIKGSVQYIHLPQWGNVNYKEADRDKGIVIADFLGGVLKLAEVLPANCGFAILLCQCKHYDKCHRAKIIDLLKQVAGESEITHREFPDVDSVKRKAVPKVIVTSGKVNGSGDQRELF